MAAKTATPAPADDEADEANTPAADETGQDEGDESQPEVIATILCYPDGSYGLVKGDEDEDEGESGGEGSEDEEPEKFPGGPAGEGRLLKAVLQTVRDYESEKSGEGTAEDNMQAGYGETPPEPIQQKYNEV